MSYRLAVFRCEHGLSELALYESEAHSVLVLSERAPCKCTRSEMTASWPVTSKLVSNLTTELECALEAEEAT